MSDDLFRARVEPRRAATPTETWPEDFEDSDEGPYEALDDLMASFDRHRVELDRRLMPAAAEAPAKAPATPADALASGSASEPSAPDVSRPRKAATPELAGDAAHDRTAIPAVPPVLPSRRIVAEPRRRSRKPWLIAGAVLAATAGAGTGAAALVGSGTGTAAPTRSVPPSTAAAVPDTAPDPASAVAAQAADWIAANVGPGHVVACDVTVCALLRGRGFPAASLIVVQSGLGEVEQAEVVVVTDVLRRRLGSELAGVLAEEPLAVFPTGPSTVEITAVALDGPRSHAARLAADRQARRTAGAALLRNPRIVVAGDARAALSAGLVDIRVCTLLSVLGGRHTITIASFTGAGPGAGADLPLPGVVISRVDGVSAIVPSPSQAALKTIVDAQQPPYAPLLVGPVAAEPEQGLAILFAQPGPIGLLRATS